MIIGITGSFGSGKTTVANLFKRYNFEVINVDKLYRKDFYKNRPLRIRIKKEFGTVNRNELKKRVFNNSNKLKKLNKITHPLIIKEIKKSIKNLKNKKIGIKIIIDAPLLIEAKASDLVDKIIVVRCNEKTQTDRLLKNKGYTKEEIDNIIKSQMPLEEKLRHADYVVDNSYSLDKTKNQIKKIINLLKT